MIKPIAIAGIAYEVDEATRKYVTKKISGLSKYLPRHAAKSASVSIRLIDKSKKAHDDEKYEAEIVLAIPGTTINAQGLSSVMSSAIDAVVTKTQSQLRDYKQATVAHIGRRGIMSRFKRSFRREL